MAAITLTKQEIYGFAKDFVAAANDLDGLLDQIHKRVADAMTAESEDLSGTWFQCTTSEIQNILTHLIGKTEGVYRTSTGEFSISLGTTPLSLRTRQIKACQTAVYEWRLKVVAEKPGKGIATSQQTRLLRQISGFRQDLDVKITEWTIIKNENYNSWCYIL